MIRSLRRAAAPGAAALAAAMALAAAGCNRPEVGPPPAGGDDEPPGATAPVEVVGTLTDEGVECPAMRGDDGELYTLTPRDTGGAEVGDRVRVTGRFAEVSFCMQGSTIEVESIEVLDDDG